MSPLVYGLRILGAPEQGMATTCDHFRLGPILTYGFFQSRFSQIQGTRSEAGVSNSSLRPIVFFFLTTDDKMLYSIVRLN